MNLWQKFELKNNKQKTNQGISFHYQKGIDDNLKNEYKSFANWLRKNYVFPVHLNVYILNSEKVRIKSGKMVYGSFRYYSDKNPSIRIPSAIEAGLLNEYKVDEIYEQILSSLVHEITHYFQWILNEEQSNATSERQANYFRYKIIEKYNSIR